MERFGFIFLVAGLGFFVLAFVVSAVLPMLPVQDLQVQTVEDLAADPPVTFLELKQDYPRAFRNAFYEKTERQAMTELYEQHRGVFDKVFSRGERGALAYLHESHPDVFADVFGDMTVDDALDEWFYDAETYIDELKQRDAQAYAAAFEPSVDSVLALSEYDLSIALVRIAQELDAPTYAAIFEDRSDSAAFASALREGHGIYIGEGCWHCHSQQIRPWGRDEHQYGQASYPEEYHNELNYPPIWGTRRIGPDLIRRGGAQSNDWHVAHFWNPRDVSPASIMPRFPWFFEDDGHTLNRKGLSIIAYVQWLGSWQTTREETIYQVGDIDRSFAPPASSPAPQPTETE